MSQRKSAPEGQPPSSFVCNICGFLNTVASLQQLERETPSCSCGSNVRFRWLIHQISTNLFGRSMLLDEFPVRKEVRAIGLSDAPRYADVLAQKFDFLNTRYDEEPFFDIADSSCGEPESLDFIVASEVFEHITPPVQPAFNNLFRLLKPHGFVVFSTPWIPDGDTQEHFANLHDWTLAKLKKDFVLVNKTREGTLEVFDQLCFHGGPGQTLEMRLFSRSALEQHFALAGFTSIDFAASPALQYGVHFKEPWSLPCLIKKS